MRRLRSILFLAAAAPLALAACSSTPDYSTVGDGSGTAQRRPTREADQQTTQDERSLTKVAHAARIRGRRSFSMRDTEPSGSVSFERGRFSPRGVA